ETSPGHVPELIPILAGDRLVWEIGYRANNTTTAERTGHVVRGGTGTPDLAIGNTGADLARPSWVDVPVSPGLTFADPFSVVNGTGSTAVTFTADADGVVISGPQ